MNLPTIITYSRLFCLPLILYWLAWPSDRTRWLSLAVFLVAASTDWLDGYLARKLDQVTELGKFLDPLVDKLLVLGPLLALIQLQQVPAWGVFLILAREIAIAGWRVNPQLASSSGITGANIWGKLKTVSQIAAIALLIAPAGVVNPTLAMGVFWLAVALTLISGLIYIYPALAKISSSKEKSISA